ncbi:MAG: hypothetical protein JW730_08300 [Anaerolineales bacterium]|nr:hypothetical protein [Anaerolineales bacterium]
MLSPMGINSTRLWQLLYAGGLLLLFAALISCTPLVPITGTEVTTTPPPSDQGTLPVTVLDESGNPLEQGVVVRVSNSAQVDDFDNNGLRIASCDQNTQAIAAWASGYEVALRKCNEPNIQLIRLNGHDNVYYSWTSAVGNCINCHAGQVGSTYDELNEWLKSGHARVFDQRYFETMYRGTSLNGGSSPLTQWTLLGGDLTRIPPVVSDGYRGPGFKLDFPEQPGNCAYCHAPAAITPSQVNVDLSTLFPKPGDVRGEGVTCDVCHKVLDVALDSNGFPFVDRPGILSYRFLRPDSGGFTIGPFSNILTRNANAPNDHRLTCSPVFSRSEFCAACHYGKFGNMVIYNSYGEWKQSSFGDNPNEPDYKTCQDCHMSHMKAGEENPPSSRRQACAESDPDFQNFDHNLMSFGMDEGSGKEIPLMIKDAAKVNVKFRYEPDKKNSLNVIVRVRNTKAGHKFPTDSPLRHLILVVDAQDQLGTSLLQVDGERIPNWGGAGKPFMDSLGIRNYGGLPGKIFANLLVEEDTNISPTAAYWNETKYAWVNGEANSDTRLVPGKEDRSDYAFTAPNAGEIRVTVTLVYRFAFFDLIAQKEWWNRSDIIVTSVECKGPPTEPDKIVCKAIE